MRKASLWQRLFGLENAVVEDVEFDAELGVVVVHARPNARARYRCGQCGRRCPRYDQGAGRRRWRALDLGTVRACVEADAPRVRCARHGVVVAGVPWARHGAGHTHVFDDTVAWLAVACAKSAVCQLMRVAWRTVGAIVSRVSADIDATVDRLDGLRRIGIDEISYKKGHKYLTIVVDHDTGRLVWAAPGHDSAVLGGFFTALGSERCARITHVSADAADWIAKAVATHCPTAVRCADPFHVVAWATEALDEERRRAWNAASGRRSTRRGNATRNQGALGQARALKRARWCLWKNPENLTEHQRAKLAWIARTDPRLHRAYLLKEGLRYVFTVKGETGNTRWTTGAAGRNAAGSRRSSS